MLPSDLRSTLAFSARRKFLKASGAGMLASASFFGCAHTRRTTSSVFDVKGFGAVGDGKVDDTQALQDALGACAQRGGGTVFVPAGTYKIRPIRLGSHTVLHLDAGSRLLGSTTLNDYPQEAAGASGHESSRAGLVTAEGAKNVSIVGRGTIDGSARAFVLDSLSYPGKDHDPKFTRQGENFMKVGPEGFAHGPYARGDDRPGNLVRFRNCQNVLVEGVTIQNSPTWTMHLEGCVNVLIQGIDINTRDNDLKIPNDDGIDLSLCQRVRIIGCDIETGDDCIAIFGSRDVAVSTCTLTCRSAGVRVGYKGGKIQDCSFDNLIIRASHRGVAVFVRGADDVENISFSNIIIETQHYSGRWWGKAEPIHVSALLWDPEAQAPGHIRNVRFRNINAIGEAGMLVYGSPDSVIEGLHFDNVKLHIRKGPLQAGYGGNFDLRSTRDKAQSIFKHDIPALHCEQVRGLTLHNFEVTWDQDLPDYFTEALALERTEHVRVENFVGRQAHDKGAAIRVAESKRVQIRQGIAAAGTDLFIHNASGAELEVVDCDARQAQRLIEPSASGAWMQGNRVD